MQLMMPAGAISYSECTFRPNGPTISEIRLSRHYHQHSYGKHSLDLAWAVRASNHSPSLYSVKLDSRNGSVRPCAETSS